MICNDCKDIFNRLSYHHDPPKSRRFTVNGKQFFLDKDGTKKPLKGHINNRKLCYDCHLKEDRKWGCRMPTLLNKLRSKFPLLNFGNSPALTFKSVIGKHKLAKLKLARKWQKRY